jgi:hypothetical protein
MTPNAQTQLLSFAGSRISVSIWLLLAAIKALNAKSSGKHSGAK